MTSTKTQINTKSQNSNYKQRARIQESEVRIQKKASPLAQSLIKKQEAEES
jgi:hypothetical protein